MKKIRSEGFTLIELLIVVAIIGIIAAIAIPSLLRARVSANESAVIGDSRTIHSSQSAFQSSSGGAYGDLSCLSTPSGCISNYPSTAPTFLDPAIGSSAASVQKGGYTRIFTGGTSMSTQLMSVAGWATFCYGASPISQNQTGVRGFGTDASGRVCQDITGATPCTAAVNGVMLAACTVIQ